ncbi:hypothetical protein B0H19DRAFT_1264434 [Mycena capillaripes]|nr:hypothetical protein B0H19DRAFT_1264434 [Mycena capillaripes]
MKFATFIALFAGVVSIGATVSNSETETRRQLLPQSVPRAPFAETNANRLARGLPPNPPAIRGTSIYGAKRGTPSNTPQCTAPGQPCDLADPGVCCSQVCVAPGFCLDLNNPAPPA